MYKCMSKFITFTYYDIIYIYMTNDNVERLTYLCRNYIINFKNLIIQNEMISYVTF